MSEHAKEATEALKYAASHEVERYSNHYLAVALVQATLAVAEALDGVRRTLDRTLDPLYVVEGGQVNDHLISRMEPIPKGTVIELHVTTIYEVTLDDDWYQDGEETMTLDEIEKTCGPYMSDVIREVKGTNNGSVDQDADWYVVNTLPEDWRKFRFDRKTEATFADPERYVALSDVLPKEVVK